MTEIAGKDIDGIEMAVITKLEALGYYHIYGPDIAPEGEFPERERYNDVILENRLKAALKKLNPKITPTGREDAFKQVQQLNSAELLVSNKHFHKLLTEGIQVKYQREDIKSDDPTRLVDFRNPENNEFLIVSQFTVIENNNIKRPDIILFINGIPLVVIELRDAIRESTPYSAFKQLMLYKAAIPSLFKYNSILVISDGNQAKAGSLSSGFTEFKTWKTAREKKMPLSPYPNLNTLIQGMLNPYTLLDIIHYFSIFDDKSKTKKLAAYHQYYAVNKAVEKTKQTVVPGGDGKSGIVWHIHGSDKPLTIVSYLAKIASELNNFSILVITDGPESNARLFNVASLNSHLLRQSPVQANSRQHLKELIKPPFNGIFFITIKKLLANKGSMHEAVSKRKNILVIADELQYIQYSFRSEILSSVDQLVNNEEKRRTWSFANYLGEILPNATYLGFTGTYIEETEVNTFKVFGDYVDTYSISQALKDDAMVKIYYESRLIKFNRGDEAKQLVKELNGEFMEAEPSHAQKPSATWVKLEALIGSQNRIKKIARDIITHFEQRAEVLEGKGIILTMSRRIATELYGEIIKLRPTWHHGDFDKGIIKVMVKASSSRDSELARHLSTGEQQGLLSERMKDANDELKLVIICDEWPISFDIPSIHTLYIDTPMTGQNFMRAIGTVGQAYKDKPSGLLVDYLDIVPDFKETLALNLGNGYGVSPISEQKKAVELMLERLRIVSNFLVEKPESGESSDFVTKVAEPKSVYLKRGEGLLYEEYLAADSKKKLKIILSAQEHILALPQGKKRFTEEVTALSRQFATSMPHQAAIKVKNEVSFFQTIKSRLSGFDLADSDIPDQKETTIRDVIDDGLTSGEAMNIFDAAGIKKPETSIFSKEFLGQIKRMEYRHVALETLKKLLYDEIKIRAKNNFVRGNSLLEMLETAIKKHQKGIFSAADTIRELIKVTQGIKAADSRPEQFGLSEYEMGFYDAIAGNKTAKKLMRDQQLRELAIYLAETAKANISIDWTIKESTKVKFKALAKKALQNFDYPPDQQEIVVGTVLQQARLFTQTWNNK